MSYNRSEDDKEYEAYLDRAEVRKNKRIARYRELAQLEEGCKITEENFDDEAFTKVCVEDNADFNKVRAELLAN